MSARATRRPQHGLLGVYLNDHLAGSAAGIELARGWQRRPSRDPRPRARWGNWQLATVTWKRSPRSPGVRSMVW